MPYKIKGNTVIKKDTGEVVGHSKHPKEYLKALYANADKGHHSAANGSFIDLRASKFGVNLNA